MGHVFLPLSLLSSRWPFWNWGQLYQCCDYGWHQHSVFKPHRLLNYGIKTYSNGFKQICKIVKPPLFGDGRPPFLSCSNTFDLYTKKSQIIFLKLRWQLWNQVRKLGSLSHLSKVGVNYQKLGQSTTYAFFVVLCCVFFVLFCCFFFIYDQTDNDHRWIKFWGAVFASSSLLWHEKQTCAYLWFSYKSLVFSLIPNISCSQVRETAWLMIHANARSLSTKPVNKFMVIYAQTGLRLPQKPKQISQYM